VVGGKSVDHIVKTPELRSLASKIMLDVITAANTDLGGGLEGGSEGGREGGGQGTETVHLPSNLRIERGFHDHMFALTDVMGPYMSSTVLDLLAGLPMETEYMFIKPWERAKGLGVEVPYLESVVLAVEGIRKTRGL
jgi:ketopantoate reductase